MAGVPVAKKRALLSVTVKSGLGEVAEVLVGAGYELIASGGTADFLRAKDLPVVDVSELTGYPEIFGGRVKTLHPVIHGGILGPSRESFAETVDLGIEPIDLVIVNLYAFEEALLQGATEAETIEKIDIGGPTLLRAAAKNFSRVTVVPDPSYYSDLIDQINQHEGVPSLEFRRQMAATVFRLVELYDDTIARWLELSLDEDPSAGIPLRYGENPHQEARMYLPPAMENEPELSAVGLVQHGGKELSYNNIVDLVAAIKIVGDFADPCCAVVKHTNPCGFGLGAGKVGLERALLCDPVSAFGGVFAFNGEIDEETAELLAGRFLEIIVAEGYSEAALKRLTKKKNVRVLSVDLDFFLDSTSMRTRAWGDLVLSQEEDLGFPELEDCKVVAGEVPDADTQTALEMVWKICKHGKSNAIVVASNNATLGMGFGQMSRVDSTELALFKAANQDLDVNGAVAASDGFFPFPDGVEKLAEAGIRAIIAPGGSIRDDEVAAKAKELGITLVLTSRRHFTH